MNKIKRVLCGTLALAMAASMMTACGDSDSSSKSGDSGNASGGGSTSGKTEVKIYTFTEETQTMMDIFLNDPANKEIADKYEFTYTLEATASDYIQKTASALASDSEAPDLFVADADYAKQFAEYDSTAALADLGITINEADYYKYVLDFTSVDGVRKGLSHQAAPGFVLYRTDYADEVLGAKTPDDVQKYMDTWEHFEETAGKMKEKGYYMISGLDELKRCFMNNRATAWVDDDLNFTPDEATIKQYFELTKRLNDAEETQFADKTQWTPNWYSGMQDGVFCFFGCSWYLHYTIKPNCLTSKTGEADKDGNATVADADYVAGNGSFGKWGVIPGPAGYFWGGTWWFGSKQSVSRGTSEAVKAVIEYFCVNQDSVKAYMEKTGDFSSMPAVNAQLSSTSGSTYDFLGGQDHYPYLNTAANAIDVKTTTKYDDTFNSAVDTAIVDYCVGGKSFEDCMADIKAAGEKSIEGLK